MEGTYFKFWLIGEALIPRGVYLRGGANSRIYCILILHFADPCGVTSSLVREHSSLFGVKQD